MDYLGLTQGSLTDGTPKDKWVADQMAYKVEKSMTQNTPVDLLSGRWILASLACALLVISTHAHAAETPLTFGIFPYLSHQQIVSNFTPLRDYLQQASGQKLAMSTASDFASFRDRTKAGEYDIILTAPHLARLAEKESRFQRIAITRYRVNAVILVPKDSPVQKLSDLRGKSLAVPPAAAMVTLLATELFRSKGMEPGRDFALREFGSIQSSMVAPLRGDADASAAGFVLWSNFEQKDKLRIIAKSAEVPGLIIMAHPRVPRAMVARLRKALFAFGDTQEGKTYFATTGHGAWLPVDDATMRSLDPYMRHARD